MTCIAKIYFERDEEGRGARPPIFQIIRTEFQSFSDLLDAIEADENIRGQKLFTRRAEAENTMEVVRVQPTYFRGVSVMRAYLPEWVYVDTTASHPCREGA
ncbi:hypothetical protein [Pseudophaeobacter sp. C1-32P7]|uniref:hypothetical protein n=1 Tax=Pseudophaeobacter sp. C1-32P7 TaxID=3098142 RepID=UPI0034D78A30